VAGVELSNPFSEAHAGPLDIFDGDSEFQVKSSRKLKIGLENRRKAAKLLNNDTC
jgi:hypothetical protein